MTQTFYGDLEQFQPAGTPRVRNFRFHEYVLFLQDDWKLRPGLTLNFGLRYEFHAPPSDRDRLQGTLDQAAQISRLSRISDFILQRTGGGTTETTTMLPRDLASPGLQAAMREL